MALNVQAPAAAAANNSEVDDELDHAPYYSSVSKGRGQKIFFWQLEIETQIFNENFLLSKTEIINSIFLIIISIFTFWIGLFVLTNFFWKNWHFF